MISIMLSISVIYRWFLPTKEINRKIIEVYETDDRNIEIHHGGISGYNLLQSTPPPSEICALIKGLNSFYHKNLVASVFSENKDSSDFKTALRLGIYYTDMTYLCTFGQTTEVLSYLEGIKKRENKLIRTIKKHIYPDKYALQNYELNNVDSLLTQMSIEIENFQKYLYQIDRVKLNMLISTGVFVEALYIALQTYEANPNIELRYWMGAQLIVLDQLLLMLSFYEEVPKIKDLIEDLHKIKKIYDRGVNFEYTYKEKIQPAIEENGILVQKDNYTLGNIHFDNQTLTKIHQITTEIRNKILQ